MSLNAKSKEDYAKEMISFDNQDSPQPLPHKITHNVSVCHCSSLILEFKVKKNC